MLLDQKYNSPCKFAADIISYLYGEIETSDKLRFEAHLASCNSCADELKGFSFVRSSVLDWHREEFLPLATPVIEIPFEKNPEIDILPVGVSTSPSRLKQIRDFFGRSPVWMTTATGFAVLTVCVGLIFMVINSRPGAKEVAGGDKTKISNSKTVSSPSAENKNVELSSASGNDSQQKPDNLSKPEPAAEKSNPSKESPEPVKISLPVNPAKPGNLKTQRPTPTTGNKSVNKTQPKTSNKITRPTLSGEEDEEESLRLSDLLEEVSMR